jgi:hypothetical protein
MCNLIEFFRRLLEALCFAQKRTECILTLILTIKNIMMVVQSAFFFSVHHAIETIVNSDYEKRCLIESILGNSI